MCRSSHSTWGGLWRSKIPAAMTGTSRCADACASKARQSAIHGMMLPNSVTATADLGEIIIMRLIGILVGSLALIISTVAHSAELKVFASRAVWTVLQEIGPEFEKENG